MKQAVILFALILLCPCLTAGSQYVYLTNGFEPSAANLALGGNPVAAVNFWHNDPLTSFSNPAFTSLQNGIRYSSSSYNFLKIHLSNGTGSLDYKASITAVGHNGIGLLASIVPEYGYETSYGEIGVYDEFGDLLNTIELSERAEIYGLALNLNEFCKKNIPTVKLMPDSVDLALGVNYIRNSNTLTGKTRYANSFDMGLLLMSPLAVSHNLQIEGALGASMFNVFNDSQKYINSNGSETIYRRLNMAAGVSANLKNTSFATGRSLGMENIVSMRLLGGGCWEIASDEKSWGIGTELGLVDMFFLRVGKHKNEKGFIEGTSYGAGLRLHYKNLIGLRYDFAHFPVVRGSKDKKCDSFGFDIDIIGLVNSRSLDKN